MKNKIFILGLFLLFVLPLALKLAASQEIPGIPSGLSPEQIEAQMQKLQQLRNQSEWAYIGGKFGAAMLRNPIIQSIDAFCTKISIVFRVLFGMDYSLSLTLLFVIVLWLIVFIDGGNILKHYSMFSALTSYGIMLAVAVILAQVQVFKLIVNFTGTLIYAREAGWARFLIFVVVCLALLFVDWISRYFGKYLQKGKEAKEKAETLTAGKEIQARAKGLREGEKLAK